jgi:hypothetical protein
MPRNLVDRISLTQMNSDSILTTATARRRKLISPRFVATLDSEIVHVKVESCAIILSDDRLGLFIDHASIRSVIVGAVQMNDLEDVRVREMTGSAHVGV